MYRRTSNYDEGTCSVIAQAEQCLLRTTLCKSGSVSKASRAPAMHAWSHHRFSNAGFKNLPCKEGGRQADALSRSLALKSIMNV